MRVFTLLFTIIAVLSFMPTGTGATSELDDIYAKRMALYERIEAVTTIPWYYLAAIDQYERNVRQSRRDLPKAEGITGIYFKPEEWVGVTNPNIEDEDPKTIQFFNGIGFDGDGDGKASLHSDDDVLYAFANFLLRYGTDYENIKIGVWNYYKRDKSVRIIMGKAKLYENYGKLNLDEHVFPVPIGTHYSYRSTWGSARGWGGRRIHEGTDIFADYGLPVRATSYGIVEMKGWNKYGGWRVGIRDINNNYHYYAHLSGFSDDLKVGQIVEPGKVIGGVGSSGYGPKGTSGKFPPHLHYGMYKDNGYTEWSYDPYPHLNLWERQERSK